MNTSTTTSLPDNRLCLSRRELAQAIGLSERTVYALTEDHDLPHVRLGRRVLYPRVAIEQWLTERAQKAAMS